MTAPDTKALTQEITELLMGELNDKLQPLLQTLVEAEVEKRLSLQGNTAAPAAPAVTSNGTTTEQEGGGGEEEETEELFVPSSILRSPGTPVRFETQHNRSGLHRRRLSFGRIITRMFQPTSPSDSSATEEEAEEEEDLSGILVYDRETHDTWKSKSWEDFIYDFDIDGIANMSNNQVKQILFLAKAKDLLVVMEHDVLNKANRKAWPGRRNHRKKKDKIIKQIDDRLTKEWNDNQGVE